PDADVENVVKEIIDKVNFNFTTNPQESPRPSNLIDREFLRERIGNDFINNLEDNLPQEQAVRKQGETFGGGNWRKREEEKKLKELKELLEKFRVNRP
ncbi:MAG: hypothetical protein ACK4NT_03325, partial [Candidatus Omnitrophota bacterium]